MQNPQLCNQLPGELGGREGGSSLSRELKGPEVKGEEINRFWGSRVLSPGALGNTDVLSLERGLTHGWRAG